jgi:(p)ppGpp synthase/HD superfamily hydrolase
MKTAEPRFLKSLQLKVSEKDLALISVAFALVFENPEVARLVKIDRYREHVENSIKILIGLGISNPDIIIAVILHDVTRTGLLDRKKIAAIFGPKVLDIAERVSKPKKSPGLSNDSQIVKLRHEKIKAGDILTWIAAAVERLENVRALWAGDQQQKYKKLAETKTFHLNELVPEIAKKYPRIGQWLEREIKKALDSAHDQLHKRKN